MLGSSETEETCSLVGEDGLDKAVLEGLGGTFGLLLCLLEGFGGKGGGGALEIVVDVVDVGRSSETTPGLGFAAGECVSMILSICVKHVLMAEINALYCFGWDIIADKASVRH